MAAVILPKSGLPTQEKFDKEWWQVLNQGFARFDARLGLTFDGNPNGKVIGSWIGQGCFDYTNQTMYTCTQEGTAATAKWKDITGGNRRVIGKDLRLFYGTFAQAELEIDYGWAIADGRVANGFQTEDMTAHYPMFGHIGDINNAGNNVKVVAQDGGRLGYTKQDIIRQVFPDGKIGKEPGNAADTDDPANTNGQSQKPQLAKQYALVSTGGGGPHQVVEEVSLVDNTLNHVHAFYRPKHQHWYDTRPPFVCCVPLIWVGLPG